MSSASPDRKALKDHWRKLLKDAELRLTFTRQYVKEVQTDFPPGQIHNADGNYAYQHALHAETLALAEYKRVLRIFSNLLLHDKMPVANAWPQSRAAGVARSDSDTQKNG